VFAAAETAGARPLEAAQQARPASSGKPVKPALRVAASQHQARATKPRTSAQHTPRRHRTTMASAGISCVPYARAVTGMQISGNGGQWFHNAAGLYDRGNRPESGAVMVFRSAGSMSRGHVAVVRQVINPREVQIDHANWGGPGIRRGSVMQNVSVVDVSDRNDWSAVKVQVGHDADTFGRTYPLHGFIYNRPDASTGTLYAGMPIRRNARFEQVAEAPEGGTVMPVSLHPQGSHLPGARRR
jgi:surface antigen